MKKLILLTLIVSVCLLSSCTMLLDCIDTWSDRQTVDDNIESVTVSGLTFVGAYVYPVIIIDCVRYGDYEYYYMSKTAIDNDGMTTSVDGHTIVVKDQPKIVRATVKDNGKNYIVSGYIDHDVVEGLYSAEEFKKVHAWELIINNETNITIIHKGETQ